MTEKNIEFGIGDYVKKVTGEYQIYGEVRSVFQKQDGATRLVVEHKAEGGGSFLHIYGPNNLELIEKKDKVLYLPKKYENPSTPEDKEVLDFYLNAVEELSKSGKFVKVDFI